MKRIITLISGMLLGAILVICMNKVVEAQSTAPIQIQSATVHTACTLTPNVTTYCFGNDGLYVSLNGAAYTQIGGAVAGVTSVNGKTGAVTISATATAPTVTIN